MGYKQKSLLYQKVLYQGSKESTEFQLSHFAVLVNGLVTRRFARIFAFWDSSDCLARKSTRPG